MTAGNLGAGYVERFQHARPQVLDDLLHAGNQRSGEEARKVKVLLYGNLGQQMRHLKSFRSAPRRGTGSLADLSIPSAWRAGYDPGIRINGTIGTRTAKTV